MIGNARKSVFFVSQTVPRVIYSPSVLKLKENCLITVLSIFRAEAFEWLSESNLKMYYIGWKVENFYIFGLKTKLKCFRKYFMF